MTVTPESRSTDKLDIVLVTGMSGAGKTLALKTLEDMGYFCIDNLPVSLLDSLVTLLVQNENIQKTALVMDVRDPGFVALARELPEQLKALGHQVTVLFLDASREALIRRFVETRRPHPLGGGAGIEAAVDRESELLAPLRSMASYIVDSSDLNVHQLRAEVGRCVVRGAPAGMSLILTSFGFKYGIPLEAAMVLDVRFLPNPYFVDELRSRPGTDPDVAAYVFSSSVTHRVLHHIVTMVSTVIPLAAGDGRSSMMVAIGCTGGRHRSVALVETASKSLAMLGMNSTVHHRDLNRAHMSGA